MADEVEAEMKHLYARLLLVASVIGLIAVFAATFANNDPANGSRNFSGQFNGRVADFFDEGRSETTYTLRTAKGREYTVIFEPDHIIPEPGARVTLSGKAKGDTIFVDSVIDTFLVPTSHQSSGEQRIVVVLINFLDDLTENVTVQEVENRMFGPTYSADEWWQENSYGKTWATGDVFGWITLPVNRSCNAGYWRTLAIRALDDLTDLTQYNRLYILVPGAGGCGWGGLGTLGFTTYQTSNGPWTTTTSWTRSEYFNETLHNKRRPIFVTAHEVGHNFGRHHSEAIRWNAGRSLGPFDCGGCERTVTAYGDRFCSLGGSWRPGHFSAMHKYRLGWFEEENVVNVTRSGLYEIDPYAIASNVPKVLRIHRGFGPARGRSEYIFAEWRQPIGFDKEVNYFSGQSYDGLLLHYDFTTGARSYNADMTPGDNEMRNANLRSGQTWNDLYTELSINPVGVVNGLMQVMVTIGRPVLTTSYTILRGSQGNGGLSDLNLSDDLRLAIQAGPTALASEPAVWVEFTTTPIRANAAELNPGALRFELEARSSSVMRQRVRIFNYSTNTWDTVSDGDSSRSDLYVEANIWSNTARYIDPGTGQMRTRVGFFVDRPIVNWPFTVEFDQAVWKILR